MNNNVLKFTIKNPIDLITKNLTLSFFVFILISPIGNAQKKNKRIKTDSTSYYTAYISDISKTSKQFPDEAYEGLKKGHIFFKKTNNSKRTVQCLLQMSDIQKSKGKFSLSFDHLWEALYLVKQTDNNSTKASVHRKLSVLYEIFNKDEESLYHLERALQYSKEILIENSENAQQLNLNYLNLAGKQRKTGNFNRALKYLDSCIFTEKIINNKSYLMANIEIEKGYLMLKLDRLDEAYKLLHNSKSKTEDENVSQNIRIFSYLGELKSKENQLDSSIYYYEKSLKMMEDLNISKYQTSTVLAQLSKAYFKKNQSKKAYNYLVRKNKITDSIMRSKNNSYSELLEIKNTYLESLRKKDDLLSEQNITIKEGEQTQFRLKIILVLVFILGIVLFWVSRIRLKLKKSLLDKAETELESKLEKEKNEAAMKLKSKELTSYALQLIDKDSAIDELLKILQEKSPTSYKSLNSKYKKGAKDLWDEFNLRFTEVNSEFYNRLKLKHPNLTITEQKHCALIKLKFSTKEMARILNIEPHSVNISRSRIRKKLGLERSDSLEDYITNL